MSTYKIVEELGRGGMGVVYRALHPALNREVAIKFLQAGVGEASPVTMTRFKREMDVLMRLSHPSIVKVYDAGQTDGRLYYVMELLRARDLQWHLRRRGRLPVAVVRAVLDQLLDALDYLHSGGVVHRDIKLSNIVLEESGRAILMDFGVVFQEGATILTQEGHAVGTPRYFSPEMIQRGESSPASDQFSLGVVAYELLTAGVPFEGDTLPEVAQAILQAEPKPLRERRPDVPEQLAAVVHRMLAKKAGDRWPSAAAAREALADDPSMLSQSSIIPLPPAPPASRPTAKRAVPLEPRLFETSGGARVESGEAPLGKLALGVAALVAVLIAVIVRAMAPAAAPVAHAALRASEVAVRRSALGRLTLTFHTAEPTRWSVDRGHGTEAAETADATEHAIVLESPPWRPDDSLVLVSGPQRVELEPPVPLADLVHRFAAAVHERPFGAQAMDRLWVAIRSDLVKLVPRVTPRSFREALPRAPQARRRFDEHVADMKRTRGLAATLEQLGPHVGAILAAADTPAGLRAELLTALAAVDRFDALASWLAIPSPFGVHAMMEPAVEVRSDLTDELPAADVERRPLPLEPDPKGVVLVIPSEIPAASSNALLDVRDTLAVMKQATKGRAGSHRGSFSNEESPEADARRFQLEVEALDPNVYLEIEPPGLGVSLPVRLPDTQAPGLSELYWVTLTLRGALARPRGAWKMKQSRAFEEMSRLYVIVDRVLEEPLAK